MSKTYCPKKKELTHKWYLVDAKGQILGRLAAKVATILRGKHKATYTPYLDCGDFVVVINAKDIKVTGKKLAQKVYQTYSGYPGGQKETTLEKMLVRKPREVVKLAVRRMLPSGPLARDIFRKLKVYAGAEHPHKAQSPIPLSI
jgi:large subunit ribosomal protein L13